MLRCRLSSGIPFGSPDTSATAGRHDDPRKWAPLNRLTIGAVADRRRSLSAFGFERHVTTVTASIDFHDTSISMPHRIHWNFTRMVAVLRNGLIAPSWIIRVVLDGRPMTSDLTRKRHRQRRSHVSKVPFPDSCIAAKQTLFRSLRRAGRATDAAESRPSALAVFRLTTSSSAPADQPASLGPYQRNHGPCRSGPTSASSSSKLGRSCRAVLAGASPQSNRTTNARAA